MPLSVVTYIYIYIYGVLQRNAYRNLDQIYTIQHQLHNFKTEKTLTIYEVSVSYKQSKKFLFEDLTKIFRTKENDQCFKIIKLLKIKISIILLQYYYCTFLRKFELQIIQIIRESLFQRNEKILRFGQATQLSVHGSFYV